MPPQPDADDDRRSAALGGWFGFNAGSALEANGTAGLAFINTYLATACAVLSWTLGEALFKGKPRCSALLPAQCAGLVAITPAAGNVGIAGAFVIGLAADSSACGGERAEEDASRGTILSTCSASTHSAYPWCAADLACSTTPSPRRSRLPEQLVRDEGRVREHRRPGPDSGKGGRA
jgi:hypothetical protein